MGYSEIYDKIIDELMKLSDNERVVLNVAYIGVMRTLELGITDKIPEFELWRCKKIQSIKQKKNLTVFVRYTGIQGFGGYKLSLSEMRCQGMADNAIKNGAKIIEI